MKSLLIAALLASAAAVAQTAPESPEEPPPRKKTVVVPLPPPPQPEQPAPQPQAQPEEAKPLVVPAPAEPPSPEPPAGPPPALVEETPPAAPAEPPPSGATIDGHVREGAFLSGPGSLTFILHHTIMLAAGGLASQIASNGFRVDLASREAMLAGTLVGAGLGFGVSAWWQFNHWVDHPMASFGIVNSAIGGMFFTGLVDLMTNDSLTLTWTAIVGSTLGGWLTATLGGGEMPLNKGLFIASGGAWGLLYAALLLAIMGASSPGSANAAGVIDTLLIAPGIGAGAMALAGLRYDPTTAQVLRADLFGAGVGGAVLVLSALVLGRFDISTPYILALLSSAGAIATVSLLWEEAAERPALYRDPSKDRPYRNAWW
ncbi:MAG: hypothetical protein HYZ28_19215 [Myxococcales bacterium]|nr:hypothetical protein [Myxococcales bacterium]